MMSEGAEFADSEHFDLNLDPQFETFIWIRILIHNRTKSENYPLYLLKNLKKKKNK